MTLTGADLYVLLLYDLPMAALSIVFPICILFLISWASDKYRWFHTLWFVLFGLYSAWMSSYVFSGLRENGTGIFRSIFGSVLIFVGLYSVSWFLHKLAMCVVGKIREFLRDKKEQRKKSDAGDMGSVSFWVLLVLGLAAIVGLGHFIMQDSEIKLPETRSDGVAIVSSTSTPRPTATPRRTATPRPTSTPLPVSTYNGKLIIIPDYSQVCPLDIIAGTDTDYYIYLDYQYSPHLTQESRSRKATATSPYEGDIAFIVKAGQRVSIDVPIGVYKFYYATGTTFFGSKYLFGDDTQCYKADNLLSFYYADQYYQGHTITLYKTVGGNFDTDSIPDKSFPTK